MTPTAPHIDVTQLGSPDCQLDLDEADLWAGASAAERQRAASFVVRRDQLRWLAGRQHARTVAAEWLDHSPTRISLTAEPGSPPQVLLDGDPAENCYLSISRTGDYVAVALADRHIGIDVERQPAPPEASTLANRFLNPSDAAKIAADREPGLRFLQAWVRLEAILKRRGTGFDGSTPPAVLGHGCCVEFRVGGSGGPIGAIAVERVQDAASES